MKGLRFGGSEGWNELNATQAVLVPAAIIAGFFGFLFAVLLVLTAIWRGDHPVDPEAYYAALIFPGAGSIFGVGAVVLTRRSAARAAAFIEAIPAFVMIALAVAGIGGAWLMAR
jgi:hypothetical protein